MQVAKKVLQQYAGRIITAILDVLIPGYAAIAVLQRRRPTRSARTVIDDLSVSRTQVVFVEHLRSSIVRVKGIESVGHGFLHKAVVVAMEDPDSLTREILDGIDLAPCGERLHMTDKAGCISGRDRNNRITRIALHAMSYHSSDREVAVQECSRTKVRAAC